MNDNIDKMCFVDLIKKGKIRIPQIQRDYAQGRKHKGGEGNTQPFCT